MAVTPPLELAQREKDLFLRDELRLIGHRQETWSQRTWHISEVALKILALKSVGYSSLVASSLLSVAVLSHAVFVPVSIIVSLGALGIACVYFALRAYDYTDAQTLETERNTLYGEFLALKEMELRDVNVDGRPAPWLYREVIKKHGMANIFKYGIPRPYQLKEMVAFTMQHASFQEGLYLLKQLKKAHARCADQSFSFFFDNLAPILKERFAQSYFEGEHLKISLDEFFQVANFDEMCAVGILTEEAANHLKANKRNFLEEKSRFEERVGQGIIDTYQRDLTPYRHIYQLKVHRLQKAYDSHPMHAQMDYLMGCLEKALANQTGRREQDLYELRWQKDRTLAALDVQKEEGLPGVDRQIANEEARFQRKKNKLLRDYDRDLKLLTQGFMSDVAEKQRVLDRARNQRDLMLQKEKETFVDKTDLLKKRFQEISRSYRRELDDLRAQITGTIVALFLDPETQPV